MEYTVLTDLSNDLSRINGIVKYLVDVSEVKVDLPVQGEELFLKRCSSESSNFVNAAARPTPNGCSRGKQKENLSPKIVKYMLWNVIIF
jgi:hypothetical protein